MKIKALLILCLLFGHPAFAANLVKHEGRVTQVVSFPLNYGSYSEQERGLLAIYIEDLPRGCNNGSRRVVIGEGHAMYDSVLAMSLFAKATNTSVTVTYFDECTIRGGSWDLANIVVN